jgi:hypothetical protein
MKKNFKSHLLAVWIAWVLSCGLYLILITPDAKLSADILGIPRWDIVNSDLLIVQSWDEVQVTANRDIADITSLHILMMYDPDRINFEVLDVSSVYEIAESFQKSQWSVVITLDNGWVIANEELFVLQWINEDEDLIMADIQAIFEDGSIERLLFSQP